jgi:uncharacterized membrane protein
VSAALDIQRSQAMSEQPPTGEGYEAVISDNAGYYIVVAEYPNTAKASQAYKDLLALEQTTTLRIDGVVVAHCDMDGKIVLEKMTEHSTRSGLRWGVVGGIVVGVLFPPAILGSALATGTLGAIVGKIRNTTKRSGLAKELEASMAPGTSAIVALVEDQAMVEVERALESATRIVSKAVDHATAMEIDAEAEAAKKMAGV